MEETQRNENCPCKRTGCSRHGDCAACRTHHHPEGQNPIPTACERLREKQARDEQRKARRSERRR